ncbi:hypothetical protein V8C37DRAFT_371696 [Trichoderma ceciliae]
MPPFYDELGNADVEEPFAQFFVDDRSANSSRQASPVYPLRSPAHSPAIPSAHRFSSLVRSPVSPVSNSVRSSVRPSLVERLDAVGDKAESLMQPKDSGRLSSVFSEPKPSPRLRPVPPVHKEEPMPTRQSLSLTKRDLRPREKTDAKSAIRKVGRPAKTAKTATPQRKKRLDKGGEATPDVRGGRKEWEVEEIVDSRIDQETLQHWFRVKWKGYTNKDNTWEPKKNLANCKTLVEKYERKARK